MFLYEQMDFLRQIGTSAEVPPYIPENLNPALPMRPYQRAAFENFITYFENDKLRQRPTQILFHMATGSGKTLIMAGLMLYLYRQGYRNFLFFVNLSNIVQKTKENFLNAASRKYLFARTLTLDGEEIPIREVANFQTSADDAIHICFTTTQALHSELWNARENGLALDDFAAQRVVLISDEAHHLNADLKKMSQAEQDSARTWESTVRAIFTANRENVLLEFTATCDIENPLIKKEYEDKIIFDYPLFKFRADGYSKEIKTLRSDLDVEERALQALVLSQYRYKVFQDYRQAVKPVVFFQSRLVKENRANMARILAMVDSLTGRRIQDLLDRSVSETLGRARDYFLQSGISWEELASELRDDFSAEHCISANDDGDVERRQLLLNSLEDRGNPYRAVFAVDKLNEGWDVLNLFDIVRLYETRDGKNGVPGKTTMKEAQLIGRGARYCPFQITGEQEKYRRKYDSDIDHPLRVCETLYYHCWNEPRYISELHAALREIGIDLDRAVTVEYRLKEAFKKDELYRSGLVFANERIEGPRRAPDRLSRIRERVYPVFLATGRGGEDLLLEDGPVQGDEPRQFTCQTTIAAIGEINYAIVHRALCQYPVFQFDRLKARLPALRSTREFIFDEAYLGPVRIHVTSRYEHPSAALLYAACVKVLGKIAQSLSDLEEAYEGSCVFTSRYLHDVFRDKRCTYTDPQPGGLGISQNDGSVPPEWRLDLSGEDWFAFEDNFGTGEEKAFVAHFKACVPELKKKYDKLWLLRNERQLALYSFRDGKRFEPDYLLFLRRPTLSGHEWLQVFIEPKGAHLIENDRWKEEFLLQLEERAVPVVPFADDNSYQVRGLPFFNRDAGLAEFDRSMDRL